MQRIAIIGSPGSGKSTLARELSRRLALPVHHLDRIYWRPGWDAMPRPEFEAIQQSITSSDRWIFDGNYGGTMPIRLKAADTIILLDLPPWVCLSRVLRRSFGQRTRPDMGIGCREQPMRREYAEFLVYTARFRRQRLPDILERLGEFSDKTVHHLQSKTAITAFLKEHA